MDNQKNKNNLPRTMNVSQLLLISVGSMIGSGFFLGSGIPLFKTGRSAILAYLLGGIFMYLTISILAEMTASQPVEGGFSTYAEQYFSRCLGFISGWMYWTSGVMTMASEVVAAAIFTTLWFPGIPLWVFSIIYSLIMVLINTRDTSGFAKVEGALSILELTALVGFIILAGWGLSRFLFPSISPAYMTLPHNNFFTHGWQGFGGSLLFVMSAYNGISVVAMSAAEAKDPGRTIPKAIRTIALAIPGLYLIAIFLITMLLPTETTGAKISPFVLTLSRLHLSWGAFIMNVVILIAALSSMNTALFGVTRMLRSLGERGDAPKGVVQLNKHGVPTTALWVSSIALGVTISLSFFLPQNAFALLNGATSLVSMFNWGLIALIHLRFRKKNQAQKVFNMWGYPWTSHLSFVLAVTVALSAWLVPSQRVGFIGLFILFGAYSLIYNVKASNSAKKN